MTLPRWVTKVARHAGRIAARLHRAEETRLAHPPRRRHRRPRRGRPAARRYRARRRRPAGVVGAGRHLLYVLGHRGPDASRAAAAAAGPCAAACRPRLAGHAHGRGPAADEVVPAVDALRLPDPAMGRAGARGRPSRERTGRHRRTAHRRRSRHSRHQLPAVQARAQRREPGNLRDHLHHAGSPRRRPRPARRRRRRHDRPRRRLRDVLGRPVAPVRLDAAHRVGAVHARLPPVQAGPRDGRRDVGPARAFARPEGARRGRVPARVDHGGLAADRPRLAVRQRPGAAVHAARAAGHPAGVPGLHLGRGAGRRGESDGRRHRDGPRAVAAPRRGRRAGAAVAAAAGLSPGRRQMAADRAAGRGRRRGARRAVPGARRAAMGHGDHVPRPADDGQRGGAAHRRRPLPAGARGGPLDVGRGDAADAGQRRARDAGAARSGLARRVGARGAVLHRGGAADDQVVVDPGRAAAGGVVPRRLRGAPRVGLRVAREHRHRPPGHHRVAGHVPGGDHDPLGAGQQRARRLGGRCRLSPLHLRVRAGRHGAQAGAVGRHQRVHLDQQERQAGGGGPGAAQRTRGAGRPLRQEHQRILAAGHAAAGAGGLAADDVHAQRGRRTEADRRFAARRAPAGARQAAAEARRRHAAPAHAARTRAGPLAHHGLPLAGPGGGDHQLPRRHAEPGHRAAVPHHCLRARHGDEPTRPDGPHRARGAAGRHRVGGDRRHADPVQSAAGAGVRRGRRRRDAVAAGRSAVAPHPVAARAAGRGHGRRQPLPRVPPHQHPARPHLLALRRAAAPRAVAGL